MSMTKLGPGWPPSEPTLGDVCWDFLHQCAEVACEDFRWNLKAHLDANPLDKMWVRHMLYLITRIEKHEERHIELAKPKATSKWVQELGALIAVANATREKFDPKRKRKSPV